MPLLLNRDVSFCKKREREGESVFMFISLDGSPVIKCIVVLATVTSLFTIVPTNNVSHHSAKVISSCCYYYYCCCLLSFSCSCLLFLVVPFLQWVRGWWAWS